MEQDNLFELPVMEGIPIMEFPSFDFNTIAIEDEAKETSMELMDTLEI